MANVDESGPVWAQARPITHIEHVKDTARSTLEVVLSNADEADIYGILSGLTGFAQHILKKQKEHAQQPAQHQIPKQLHPQGGQYL